MRKDLSLSSVIEEYSMLEENVISLTKKHPVIMLSAATGLGFALGCFGVMRVLQAGVAISLQDRASLRKMFNEKLRGDDATRTDLSNLDPQAHA